MRGRIRLKTYILTQRRRLGLHTHCINARRENQESQYNGDGWNSSPTLLDEPGMWTSDRVEKRPYPKQTRIGEYSGESVKVSSRSVVRGALR